MEVILVQRVREADTTRSARLCTREKSEVARALIAKVLRQLESAFMTSLVKIARQKKLLLFLLGMMFPITAQQEVPS